MQFAANSLKVSLIAAVVTVFVALLLHFDQCLVVGKFSVKIYRLSLQISSIGYAILGTVLAIELLLPTSKLHALP